MLAKLYSFSPNYLHPFGLMLFIMQFSSSIVSLILYFRISPLTLSFTTNSLIFLYWKSLDVCVMLLLWLLIEPNYSLEPENPFFYVTSKDIKVLLFMIFIVEKSLYPNMSHFMKIFFLIIIHLLPHLLIGNISLTNLLNLLLILLHNILL